LQTGHRGEPFNRQRTPRCPSMGSQAEAVSWRSMARPLMRI
jgi:hypothetical protein